MTGCYQGNIAMVLTLHRQTDRQTDRISRSYNKSFCK